MADQYSAISQIKDNGWEQGSFVKITNEKLIDKSGVSLKQGSQYLLISQDCDIVRELDKEPYFELLCVSVVEKANGNFTKGKNSRTLHLEVGQICLECIAYEKIYVEKRYFVEVKSDRTIVIGNNNLDILNYWLSNRNSRVAYPDEFNRRLREQDVNKKIAKTMGRKGVNVKGIYVKLHPFKEVTAVDEYKLIILFLVSPQCFNDADNMSEIDICFEEVVSLINKIKGINLVETESKIRSTDDITVYEFQQYFKWDMDYVSYSDDIGETMPGTNQI